MATARPITACPLCDAPLRITELTCTRCDTRLKGTFAPAPLAHLSPEHQQFAETFLRCRGVIRDVERVLGISYPTVRAKLDAVVAALETATAEEKPLANSVNGDRNAEKEKEAARRALLRQLESGEIDPEHAIDGLRRL